MSTETTFPDLHIPANDPGYKTGIILKKECRYNFSVPEGQTWNDKGLRPFTADGRDVPWLILAVPFLRKPSVKWFALCGMVNAGSGQKFKIGSGLTGFSPEEEGELICFANDVPGFYGNNSGELLLKITEIKTH
jgi:hypothetical protein